MTIAIRLISVASFLPTPPPTCVCPVNYIYDNCHGSKQNTIGLELRAFKLLTPETINDGRNDQFANVYRLLLICRRALLHEFAADFPAFMANLNMNATRRNTGDVRYSGDEDEIWLLLSKRAFSPNVWIFYSDVLIGNCQGFFSVSSFLFFSHSSPFVVPREVFVIYRCHFAYLRNRFSSPFASRVLSFVFFAATFSNRSEFDFCYFLWNVHVRSIADQFRKLMIHRIPSAFALRFLYNFINIVEFIIAKCTRGMFRR